MSHFWGCIFVIVLCILGLSRAAPQGNPVQILRFENDHDVDGYKFSYETSDGTTRDETGSISPDSGAISVKGSYSYQGDDGILYTVRYIADENGFQPEGAHIPNLPDARNLSPLGTIGESEMFNLGLPPSAVISLVG